MPRRRSRNRSSVNTSVKANVNGISSGGYAYNVDSQVSANINGRGGPRMGYRTSGPVGGGRRNHEISVGVDIPCSIS